jgi:hypothetical protein
VYSGFFEMEKQQMNNQEILDNAPEGATHIDGEHDFCKDGYYFSSTSQRWISSEFVVGSRSLADIKRIVELEKALYKLIDQASLCDSWECFPSDWLDEAYKSLTKGGAE